MIRGCGRQARCARLKVLGGLDVRGANRLRHRSSLWCSRPRRRPQKGSKGLRRRVTHATVEVQPFFEGAVAVSQVSVIDWRRAVGQPLKLAV